MAQRPPAPEPQPHNGASVPEPDDGFARPPRWVMVFLIIGVALVVLFVAGKVTGVGGDHGPGRHGGDDDPTSSVVDDQRGHQPPVDHGPSRMVRQP
jgi:hypothetical protein